MGYEVLDADGAPRAGPGLSSPPPDVIAFEDLPPPATEPHRARPARRGPDRSWSHWRRRSSKLVWVLVAVAALVGGIAGSWWTNWHGDQVRRAQARAVVQAYASALSVNPVTTGDGMAADYTVQIVNLGALPVTLAVSPTDARPTALTPVISTVTGDARLAPGAETLVKIRIPLDCKASASVRLRVPIRSPDGTVHQVGLRENAENGTDTTPADICSMNGQYEQLAVSLVGTLDQPRLEVRNNTDAAMTVTLDSGSPLTQEASQLISLTTLPRLPLVVRAQDTTTLQLRVTAARCRQDLSGLSALQGYGYLSFQGDPTSQSSEAPSAGVDASPLLGAAMARACSAAN